jgi:hypothetical protein
MHFCDLQYKRVLQIEGSHKNLSYNFSICLCDYTIVFIFKLKRQSYFVAYIVSNELTSYVGFLSPFIFLSMSLIYVLLYIVY